MGTNINMIWSERRSWCKVKKMPGVILFALKENNCVTDLNARDSRYSLANVF